MSLSEAERVDLADAISDVLVGSGYYSQTLATDERIAAVVERIVRAHAGLAWDEGWRAGRGRGPGHTDACPIGGSRRTNPYRQETDR